MTKTRNKNNSAQSDLFSAFVGDVPTRDQRDTMERPFFALGKKKRLQPINYVSPDGNIIVNVSPHQDHGMATIWDADILIWAASQIVEAANHGLPHNAVIKFHPYDLLLSIDRGTSGQHYNELRAALNRLSGTLIQTNIRTPGRNKFSTFHWLEGWTEEVDEKTGKSLGMTMTVPKWFYDGVTEQGGVLRIARDYFGLTGGLERWLYRVARKHGGKQNDGWALSMEVLHHKSGSTQRLSDFARDIRKLVAANSLPEYQLEIFRDEQGREIVSFIHRELIA